MVHPVDPAPLLEASSSGAASPMLDFRAVSAVQWRRELASGEVSAVDLVTTAITAASNQSQLGAFLHLDPASALLRAAEIDEVRRAVLDSRASGSRSAAMGELAGRAPLLGMPTAFKDLVDVAGMPTTRGTNALPATMPAHDHRLARRVHASGAISLGKTQVPEFGLPCYSENELAPAARNPLAPERTAGGSTGGGAAAVAAGMLPLAPGSDGGGSVRIPAAACGLIGLKPGRGRLPDDDPRRSVRNLAVAGPIAHTAEDAALLFDVMAGHRFHRSGSADRLPAGPALRRVHEALEHGVEQLRIGVITESPFSPELDVVLAESAVLALERGLSRLEQRGHILQGSSHCTGAEAFWPADYHRHFQALWTAPLGELDPPADQLAAMAPLTRYFIELARNRPEAQTRESIAALEEFAADAEAFMGPWDVLATPMLAFAPPEIGWFAGLEPEENYRAQCRFTPYSSVVNVMGLPAINVPTYTDAQGLSWSIQLIGRHGSEEQLLALAATLAQD
ncbi:amidase [Nesterenkonia sandarakina]|uniref:Amidase n=1 Tax=Nesterenkonia sandarakina TaxID=272918 RepID=A0A7Z0E8B6_9MICC|nr:amidase [Nesterenkonia sandarakina]NYJ16495.1 amidase [Nesterenkonia sandarakina]